MWQDPIVEEVRKVRDAHAAQHGYDLKAIFQALKQEEAASERKFVKLAPKRIEVEQAQTNEA